MATTKDLIETVKAFRTQFEREPVISNPGEGIKDEFGSRIDKNGRVIVSKKGTTDLYSYIQSFADSTDINVLLKRFANGDESALNQRRAEYMDITEMPSTYAELLNKLNDGKELFDALPIELKNKYGNSFNKWIVESGSKDWLVDMGLYKEKETVVNEKTADEV